MVRAEQSVPILVDVGLTGGGRAVSPLVVRIPERRGGYHAVAHHEHGVRLVRVLVVTRRQPDAVPELDVEKSVARARVVAVRRVVTGVEELLGQHHAVGERDLRRVDERVRPNCEGGEKQREDRRPYRASVSADWSYTRPRAPFPDTSNGPEHGDAAWRACADVEEGCEVGCPCLDIS